MTAIDVSGGDREPVRIAAAPIGGLITRREELELLALVVAMLAVMLMLALTLGVSPPG